MSFLSRISLITLLCCSLGTAGAQEISPKQQFKNLWAKLCRKTATGRQEGWQKTKTFFTDMGTVAQQEWRYARGKDIATGESVAAPAGGQEGFFAGWQRRGKESAMPAVLATGSTIAASYLFETIFQTASRRRKKGIVLPLLLLASWYGTHMAAARTDLAPEEGQTLGNGVGKRLAALGITSGVLTFVISLIKQWTRGDLDNDDTLTDEQKAAMKKKRPGFKQHLLWGAEVGSMYSLAAYLGYVLQRTAGPKADGNHGGMVAVDAAPMAAAPAARAVPAVYAVPAYPVAPPLVGDGQ